MNSINPVNFVPIGGECKFCGAPAVAEVRKGIAPNTWVDPIKICQAIECLKKTFPKVPRANKRKK